jgi:hypothetical protein
MGELKRWMMFVDGENLAIRAKNLAAATGTTIPVGRWYKEDVWFWPENENPTEWGSRSTFGGWSRRHLGIGAAERCYYYTCTPGDDPAVNDVHDALASLGFSPTVIRKPKGGKAKGVDITLTKDMLVQAFLGNYDVAVLVAGDGDFRPVVEEVKRLGKWVIVSFFNEQNGLNPDLRRAADEYVNLTLAGR